MHLCNEPLTINITLNNHSDEWGLWTHSRLTQYNETLRTCVLVDKYRMRFNFRGVYISRFCKFHVFKFAVAGYSGAEIFAGEIFADIRSESVYHNSIRQLQRCKTAGVAV